QRNLPPPSARRRAAPRGPPHRVRSPETVTRAVLFDLDDTLFDHRESARAALSQVHRTHAPSIPFDTFEQHHLRHLEELHLEVLAHRLSIDDARRERFRRVFASCAL